MNQPPRTYGEFCEHPSEAVKLTAGLPKLKGETVGFVRGGMLFLEPPWRWRVWQRDIWNCCGLLSNTRLPGS